ncbi:MAG: hypothetical protein LBH54_03910, partial [Clostridiales bacterium]|nr:hypothetical protein [Clostridiales bacterium]
AGLPASLDAALTAGGMNQLLYNVLSVPSWEVIEVKGGQPIYGSPEPSTILERRYQMVLVKGVFTAVGIASIFGPSNLRPGTIEIDRMTYRTGENDFSAYLGQSVAAFAREDGSDVKEIMFLEPAKNTIAEFRAADLREVTSSAIKTEDGAISYDSGARIVLNGVYYGIAANGFPDFADGNARFTAIDNNSDGDTDVFLLRHYAHFAARYKVGDTGTLSLRYGARFGGGDTVNLEESAARTVKVTKDGVPAPYTDILAGDSVAIAYGADASGKEVFDLLVSSKTVTAAVKEVFSDNDGVSVRLSDDKVYQLSYDYQMLCGILGGAASADAPRPKLGKTYLFRIAADGLVAGVEEVTSSLLWGYLVGASAGKGLATSGKMKLFTAKGEFLTYEITDKILYHDKDNLAGVRISGKEAADKIAAPLQSDPTADIRAMVCYTVDAEDNLTELYMPYDNTAGRPGSVDYPNTYDVRIGDETATERYYHYKFPTSGWFTPPGNMLFIVPDYESRNLDEAYRISTLQDEKELPSSFGNVRLYGADEYKITKASMMMLAGTNIDLSSGVALTTYLIDKVTRAVDKDGQEILKIYGWSKGEYANIACNKPEMLSQETGAFIANVKAGDLQKGDVMQFTADASGNFLGQFRVLLLADNPGSYRYLDNKGVYTSGYEDMSTMKYYFGYVRFMESKSALNAAGEYHYLKYTDGVNTNVNIVKSGFMKDCVYYLVRSGGEIEKITLADLLPGDNIAFGHSWYDSAYVVAYRE